MGDTLSFFALTTQSIYQLAKDIDFETRFEELIIIFSVLDQRSKSASANVLMPNIRSYRFHMEHREAILHSINEYNN
ncbi:MAG: hypothetical protein EZS28_024186 [Streblomastix strix]|uniref:Uncharacterized protein n=1 Tax=Streblomastix strix TaxID=222440 RepID=A0A5J4VCI4_9EUKA|nr:MAG: hypothetical protein EZS28_024186 [Streblomastix strix]